MNGSNLDLLLKVSSMVELLGKSLGFLINNPNDEQMRQTTADCVSSISQFVDLDLFDVLAEALASGKELNSNGLSQLRDGIMGQLTTNIYARLSEAFNDHAYVDKETADRLFSLMKSESFNSLESVDLLYKVTRKASVSTPMEAYLNTIRLFEAQPAILSGENAPHPGYEYKPEPQRTFDKCPICGGEGIPYFRAFAYSMEDFRPPHLPAKLWMKCPECGNMYTWQYPEELLAESNQEQQMISPEPDKFLTALGTTSCNELGGWYDILARLTMFTPGRSLLEVGIGTGEMLAVALELGFGVTAVEIVPSMCRKVANMLDIPVWNVDFLKFKTTNKYAIITMGDVIEHMQSPVKALEKAYDLLMDDGVLWISTPNFESSFSRMMKFEDSMWCKPYHISYFSFTGFLKIAEKAGFEVLDYGVSKRYNGSMELILKKKR